MTLTDVAQIFTSFFDTGSQGLFTFTNPDTGIIELDQWHQ